MFGINDPAYHFALPVVGSVRAVLSLVWSEILE